MQVLRLANKLSISSLKRLIPYWLRLYARNAIEYPEYIGRALRHRNAFATHIPVLTAVGRTMPIQRILEFGSGTISTLHFLNPRVFPTVSSVVSFENDLEWYEMVRSRSADPRLKLNFVSEDMYTVASSIDLKNFDLIFVDDSKSAAQRSQTIKHLAARKHDISGLVAIHDFEQRAYREAASPFVYCKRFRAFNPEVGLVWSRNDITPAVFRHIDQTIKSNAQQLEPDDTDGWVRIFEAIQQ